MDQVVWPDLEATFARLEADARAVLAATLPDGASPAITRLADIRYVGQASELVVPLPAGPYTAASRGVLMQAFEASYVAAFTRTPPTTQVEIINVRVSASIEIGGACARAADKQPARCRRSPRQRRGRTRSRACAPSTSPSSASSAPPPSTTATRSWPGRPSTAPPSSRSAKSTLVVGPGGRFEVAPSGNIIVTIG